MFKRDNILKTFALFNSVDFLGIINEPESYPDHYHEELEEMRNHMQLPLHYPDNFIMDVTNEIKENLFAMAKENHLPYLKDLWKEYYAHTTVFRKRYTESAHLWTDVQKILFDCLKNGLPEKGDVFSEYAEYIFFLYFFDCKFVSELEEIIITFEIDGKNIANFIMNKISNDGIRQTEPQKQPQDSNQSNDNTLQPLQELKSEFNNDDDYNKAVILINNFFSEKLTKIEKPIFIKSGNTKKLAFALGEIWRSKTNNVITVEYLQFYKKAFSIFANQNIDEEHLFSCNLYKYSISKT